MHDLVAVVLHPLDEPERLVDVHGRSNQQYWYPSDDEALQHGVPIFLEVRLQYLQDHCCVAELLQLRGDGGRVVDGGDVHEPRTGPCLLRRPLRRGRTGGGLRLLRGCGLAPFFGPFLTWRRRRGAGLRLLLLLVAAAQCVQRQILPTSNDLRLWHCSAQALPHRQVFVRNRMLIFSHWRTCSLLMRTGFIHVKNFMRKCANGFPMCVTTESRVIT